MKIKKTKKTTDYEGSKEDIDNIINIAIYTSSEKLIEKYAKQK
jgi:hypothetical protein